MRHVIIVLLLGGLIAMSSCGPRDNTERSVYSRSQDGSEELLYFYDSVAFHRHYDTEAAKAGADVTPFYSLGEAHWLNKPTLVACIGHRVERELVAPVISLNSLPDRRIVYGIENVTNPETGDEQKRYFVLQGFELWTFEKESEFMEFMAGLGVHAPSFIEAKDVIPTFRTRLPKQRW